MNGITLFGLYLAYYFILPLAILLPIFYIWRNKEEISGINMFSFGREERSTEELNDRFTSIKKLQVFLVVAFLLFMPLANVTFSNIGAINMGRERQFFGAFGSSRVYDPVRRKVEPSFDTDSVIEEMEKNPDDWYLDDIQEQLDLDEISSIPGRLSAYILNKRATGWSYIVLTYSYLSPLPMARTFGFRIYRSADAAVLEEEEMVMYPMNPAELDPF